MRPRTGSVRGEQTSELFLEVVIRGEYGAPGPGLSGVSDVRVFLGSHDITDLLSKKQKQQVETDFESAMREELGHGE